MVLQIWNIENGILNLGNADQSNESFLLVADQKSRGPKDEKTKGRIHDAGRDGVSKKERSLPAVNFRNLEPWVGSF